MEIIDTEPYLKIMIYLIITICLWTIYVFSFTSLEVFLRKLIKKAANQQAWEIKVLDFNLAAQQMNKAGSLAGC